MYSLKWRKGNRVFDVRVEIICYIAVDIHDIIV